MSPLRAGRDAAEAAVARLLESSPDLRACAVLAGGDVLGSSLEGDDWARSTAALWEAADAGAGRPASQIHVGTEDGEVFAVRSGTLSAVATSERFTLASLALSDLRALLREVGGPAADRAGT